MSFYKEVPGRKTTLESTLKFDTEPKADSTDPVTSEGVKNAIDGAVGDASEALQEQIDDIAEKAGSGYIPKGEASVATLNDLSGQENGELYTMTDAGTLTDGSLAVVAGDTVAWDATNSVWYKAMDYAPAQYGTNEVHNLSTAITAFRTGDVIPVDGTSGTAKMGKDDLLRVTAENTLAGNVAPAFDPAKANGDDGYAYHIGEVVAYNGKVYYFILNKTSGQWDATYVNETNVETLLGLHPEFQDVSLYLEWVYNGGGEAWTGGFIDASGTWQNNGEFSSIRVYLSESFIYKVSQQVTSNKNNIRIFEDNGGTYTQVFVTNNTEFLYRPPAGKNYFMQIVRSSSYAGYPHINMFVPAQDLLNLESLDNTYDFTNDLFEINDTTGYLNGKGIHVTDANYDSALMLCENGHNYKIKVNIVSVSTANIRLFKKIGTTYEQVYYKSVENGDVTYVYVPDDTNVYYLQIPKWSSDPNSSVFKDIPTEDMLKEGELESENLWTVTMQGGYINASGTAVQDSHFDSCQLKLKNNTKYVVLNQYVTPNANNIRVFEKNGGVYTQLFAVQTNSEYSFISPKTGDIYLQVVRNLGVVGFPKINYLGFVSEVVNLESILNSSKKVIKILAIGNSYSRDNFSYVPSLLENICGMKVIFGILYKGSCTLSEHYNIFNSEGNYTSFDKYTSENGRWVTTSNYNCVTALNEEDWDIITLQQQSNASRDYSTYQPYLNDLIDVLCQKSSHTFKLGWLLTMAYPEGYTLLPPDTSDQMFNKIVTAVTSAVEDSPLSFVIPCGTATQNARHTSLDSLGNFGHLSYEGLHLQEGVPCLISAYTAAIKFMEMIGMSHKGVLSNKIRPTQSWVENLNVPERNGPSVGVNDANCILAQKCAVAAIKKPYEITENIT